MAYDRPFEAETPQEEKEGEFEDITLDRDRLTPAVAPKKSFFARLGEKSLDGMVPVERTTSKEDMPMASRFHFGLGTGTRKRGQSGGAQELGSMERMNGVGSGGGVNAGNGVPNWVPVENKQKINPPR